MSDWSQLPTDLLDQIMDLLTLPDLLRLGCVCKPWRSVCAPSQHKGRLPWLITPLDNNSPETGNIWVGGCLGFLSILDGKPHKIDLPEIEDRRIFGSSNGWLLTVHENADVLLVHPFSRRIIDLPSLTDLPNVHGIHYSGNGLEYIFSNPKVDRTRRRFHVDSLMVRDFYIIKAIVSYNNNVVDDGELVVGGLLGKPLAGQLFICRPESNKWNLIGDTDFAYSDVINYKGQVYAVDFTRNVDVVEGLNNRFPCMRRVICQDDQCYYSSVYLVESSGDLLMVVRVREPSWKPREEEVEPSHSYKTVGFKVFKLDFEQGKYLEIESFEDRAMFLGFNHSVCICAYDFPGCKGNCIYFTDDSLGDSFGGYDKGIFHLEDGSIETIYSDDSTTILPKPIWYASMLGQH